MNAGNQSRSSSWWMTPYGITWASVFVNVALTAAKIVVGVVFRSQTMLADGLHSGSDLATDFVVFGGLRVTNKPADGCHHYGHRRVSTLMGLIIGAILALVAAWIVYEAVDSLHGYIHRHNPPVVEAVVPFWLALLSVPPKEMMFRLIHKVGVRHHDLSLVANAWHTRVDAFAALAASVGLGGVLLGGPEWGFLDPLTAMLLAGFLVVAAYRISAEAAGELIDRAPSAAALAAIERAIEDTPGVQTHHAFRARRVGGRVEMDVHIQVNPALTVAQGHEIASIVKRRIMEADGDVVQAIVHVEPAGGSAGPGERPK